MVTSYTMYSTLDMLQRRTRDLDAVRFTPTLQLSPMAGMEDPGDRDTIHTGIPPFAPTMELSVGDHFTGLDRYVWIQKTLTLPEHREGSEVYGFFDFGQTGGGQNSGFESMLYLNGEPYQAVDTFHGDVNLEPHAGEEVTLTFMLWTGLDGGADTTFRHLIQRAEVGYLDTPTDTLYYLGRAVTQTAVLLQEGDPIRHRLIAALDRAYLKLDWDRDRIQASAAEALEVLSGELDGMQSLRPSEVTVHTVGHTHIDVAWLWRLKHTHEKAMRSFTTVLRLMEEFPEYVFMQSTPQLYAFVEKDQPKLFEGIRSRVAEGRWESDGGMWLEADCNITSGEALTRHFLYGMGYFMEKFGYRSTYLWLPDVFGYSWALPQILRGVGIDTFITSKISWNKFNTMPNDLFRWRGIDGSEVMGYFLTTPEEFDDFTRRYATYNGTISAHSVIGTWEKFRNKDIAQDVVLPYGLGDGGGGPNRDMLKMQRAMQRVPGLPNVRPGKAGELVRILHEDMETTDRPVPVWDGELYLEFHRGTYTSQAYNKKMNRKLEFGLAQTEYLSVLSFLRGGEYEQETFRTLWQTVLRNQFHDIIPGSSIHEVYEDSRKEYAGVSAELARLTEKAETMLERKADTYTVWHFGSFARREAVRVEETREGVFRDGEGTILPAQRTEDGYLVEVCLPALGSTVVTFTQEAAAPSDAKTALWDAKTQTLTTDLLQVTFDAEGRICALFDRECERSVLSEGARGNDLRVYEDRPLSFDNWELELFHTFKSEGAVLAKAPEMVENGRVRAVVHVEYTYRVSAISQDIVFHAGSKRIDFVTHVDWHEDSRILKVNFPVAIRATHATYDVQYGHVQRPTHYNTSWDWAKFEVVGHKWADLSQFDYGVSLLNDCKYGYSIHDSVMQLSLLKAGENPDRKADRGSHDFTYSLLPHAGSLERAETIAEATALNLPSHVVRGALALPKIVSGFEDKGIVVDCVKHAEYADALVIRMHEARGGNTRAELDFGPYALGVTPCNLLEEAQEEESEGRYFSASFHPFAIRTFLVRVRRDA